ncbi:MAG TPA: hypothetical protein VK731_13595 [Candidatus Cybelea sp.]|nr:hypothetical protein [Candidatus Cybelea sp.]
MTTALRRGRRTGEQAERAVHRPFKLRFAWALALAGVFVLIGFGLGFWRGRDSGINTGQLAEVKKYYREIEALFPNQVQAIAFDRQGPHLVLSEQADVPRSPALFVKVCGPKGCESFVTFSGQKIKFGGQQFEILADAEGKVIVVGDKRAWAGGNDSGPIRVQSRPLETMM